MVRDRMQGKVEELPDEVSPVQMNALGTPTDAVPTPTDARGTPYDAEVHGGTEAAPAKDSTGKFIRAEDHYEPNPNLNQHFGG